jgi:hypothetical protein
MLTVLSEQTTGYVFGVDEYPIKPFRQEVLLSTLEHLLASPRYSSAWISARRGQRRSVPGESSEWTTKRINGVQSPSRQKRLLRRTWLA